MSKKRKKLTIEEHVQGVLSRDRVLMGQTITLIESNAPDHQHMAQEVLLKLAAHGQESLRIGISGPPGSGKSVFIETLGCQLTDKGRRVAVLAVDPSSAATKGSILGDKTRMERLSRRKNAYIRPSPTGGALGGVAKKTRETMAIFEAAGFDVILVETVGVGQNEITVRSMVDFFMLLLIPNAGDDLQGVKRGVMEITDLVVINKTDMADPAQANAACSDYSNALNCLQPATRGWKSKALLASGLTGQGVDAVWKTIEAFKDLVIGNGVFASRRKEQAKAWLQSLVQERLLDLFYRDPGVQGQLEKIQEKVMEGSLPVASGAWELIRIFKGENK